MYAVVCLKQINKIKIYIFFQPITRIEKPASDFQLSCFGTSHSFQATLMNLSIDCNYVIQVTSVFSGSRASLCASAPENCTSVYQLFLKGKVTSRPESKPAVHGQSWPSQVRFNFVAGVMPPFLFAVSQVNNKFFVSIFQV